MLAIERNVEPALHRNYGVNIQTVYLNDTYITFVVYILTLNIHTQWELDEQGKIKIICCFIWHANNRIKKIAKVVLNIWIIICGILLCSKDTRNLMLINIFYVINSWIISTFVTVTMIRTSTTTSLTIATRILFHKLLLLFMYIEHECYI